MTNISSGHKLMTITSLNSIYPSTYTNCTYADRLKRVTGVVAPVKTFIYLWPPPLNLELGNLQVIPGQQRYYGYPNLCDLTGSVLWFKS